MTTAAFATAPPSVDTRRALALAHGSYAALMAWITAVFVLPLLVFLPVLEPGMSGRDWAVVLLAMGLGSAVGPGLYGTVAYGLHTGRTWATKAATVLALLSLNNLPFGLALGVGTLWALHGRGSSAPQAV